MGNCSKSPGHNILKFDFSVRVTGAANLRVGCGTKSPENRIPKFDFCPDNWREGNVKIGKFEIKIDGKRVPATSDEKDQLQLLTIFANIL